jgi:hypothetical protein
LWLFWVIQKADLVSVSGSLIAFYQRFFKKIYSEQEFAKSFILNSGAFWSFYVNQSENLNLRISRLISNKD